MADIHDDVRALDAAIEAGRDRGADRLVVLGDIVAAFKKWQQNSECVRRLHAYLLNLNTMRKLGDDTAILRLPERPLNAVIDKLLSSMKI